MERGSTITKKQKYSLEKTDDDVVLPTELRHRIQSLLSEEEAAQTCVLSKSWHHAWSTIPNLRFPEDRAVTTDLIYNTIQRYHDDNIPIDALKSCIKVENLELDEIQIRRILAPKTRSCLKELSLTIASGDSWVSVFTFSDDLLFSGENLQTIILNSCSFCIYSIKPGINPVIKCVSLRVLNLNHVIISEEVFHNLLSTCSLLEKVRLSCCQGLKTMKVKNLGCLRQLEITPYHGLILEIVNVPSLGFFYYKSWNKRLPFKTTDATAFSLGTSVTRLHLEGTAIDEAFFDMIKLKFPFLESLEIQINDWASERLVITSLSLKRLTLWWVHGHKLIEVYAPNLLSFDYDGKKELPTLLFPIIAPKEIKLSLYLWRCIPFDTSFFLKLREVLNNLSTKFDIHITVMSQGRELLVPLNNDDDFVDNLRRQVSVSDANVQQLSLTNVGSFNHGPGEGTRFLDALFSICHPVHVKAWNHFISRQTVSRIMQNKTTDVKEVLMKHPLSGRWEALTSSCKTDFPDPLPGRYDVEFKLNWLSHD